MPEWSLLPERDRLAVIQYVKTFYPEWQQREAGAPIYIPNPPATAKADAGMDRAPPPLMPTPGVTSNAPSISPGDDCTAGPL